MTNFEISILYLKRGRPMFELSQEELDRAQVRTPWSQRVRTSVSASRYQSMGSVFDEAVRQLGLTRASTSEDWGHPSAGELQQRLLFESEARGPAELDLIVNEEGEALWRSPAAIDLKVEDIERLSDLEVCAGNLNRLYLLIDEPLQEGGNGLDHWLEALRALEEIYQWTIAAWGAVGKDAAIAGAIYKFGSLVRKYKDRWNENGGDVAKFRQLMRRPKTTGQAAKLLAIDVSDTPPVLEFLGLELGPDDRWRQSRAPRTAELMELGDIIAAASQRNLAIEDRRRGFRELLQHPVGERSKRASSVFDKLLEERYAPKASREADVDDYILEEVGPSTYEVVRITASGGMLRVGQIVHDADSYKVRSPSRIAVGQQKNQDLHFATLDQAASWIQSNQPE